MNTNSIWNKIPQLLFTLLGIILLWALLGATGDLTQTLSTVLAYIQ